MNRRIFGIETEYGLALRGVSPHQVGRELFRTLAAGPYPSPVTNVWLPNGARLYLDVGSHPEYATAGCDSVHDLLAQDKAGERIVEGMAVEAQGRFQEQGIPGQLYVFKNNTDGAGNTFGCHENYLVGREQEWDRLTAFAHLRPRAHRHAQRRRAIRPGPASNRVPTAGGEW